MRPRAVVVFDAICVLCSANARFILRHDRSRYFALASMQGEFGAGLLRTHGIDPANPATIIVVCDGKALRESDAVLAIYQRLGWPWRAAGVFKLVPKPLRDRAYRMVARNRYRWFGKRDECWVPDSTDSERFL